MSSILHIYNNTSKKHTRLHTNLSETNLVKMTAVGKCLCGQIKVCISKEAFNSSNSISLCHCKNCTQSSGSLGSINIILPESDVQIEGELKKYSDSNTDSGAIVQRFFSGNCSSPIQSTTSGNLVLELSEYHYLMKFHNRERKFIVNKCRLGTNQSRVPSDCTMPIDPILSFSY